jgi:hypothetical protein
MSMSSSSCAASSVFNAVAGASLVTFSNFARILTSIELAAAVQSSTALPSQVLPHHEEKDGLALLRNLGPSQRHAGPVAAKGLTTDGKEEVLSKAAITFLKSERVLKLGRRPIEP